MNTFLRIIAYHFDESVLIGFHRSKSEDLSPKNINLQNLFESINSSYFILSTNILLLVKSDATKIPKKNDAKKFTIEIF